MEVSIVHRYGGHGGQATEWEIYPRSIHLENDYIQAVVKRIFTELPSPKPGTFFILRTGAQFLALPEGTPCRVAGEVAAALATLDKIALIKALKKVKVVKE